MSRISSIVLALGLAGARVPAALWLATIVFAGCGVLVPDPSTSVEPGGPAITCGGVAEATCREAVALVGARLDEEVRSALAIIVADTCPPDAECDREFSIDLAVVVVPAGPGRETLALHVFGTMRPEQVAEWQGPLPAHIEALLPTR